MSLSPASSASSNHRSFSSRQASAAKTKKTRSRNGCPQCKAKRLKCDETRPACLMCVKNGRKCPGYSQEFRWSTKHERVDFDATARREPPSSFGSLLSAAERVISESGDGIRGKKQRVLVTSHPQPRQQKQQFQSQPLVDAAAVPPSVTTAESPQVHACPDVDLLSPGRQALGLSTPSPETYPVDDLLQDFWEPALSVDALGDVTLFPDSMPLVPHHHHASAMDTGFASSSSHSMRRNSPSLFHVGGGDRHPQQQQHLVPWIPRSIMDRPSMLVEEWFKHVCTIWSCFDSEANLNRKIAADAWTRSEAVMNCMQSMAATCLSAQIPQLRQVAIASLKTAISAMKRELATAITYSRGGVHDGPVSPSRSSLPKELLFSLCCVGTAACWIDTKQLAAQFLREARTLIDRVNRTSPDFAALPPNDRQALLFFNNSIIYWDMLVAVVSDETDEDRGMLRAEHAENGAGQVVPHPWTGISAPAQRLFARAIRLCRRFRRHLRGDAIATGMSLRTALRVIGEAQQIEEELLGLEHRAVHEISETGDRLTPRAHLVDVAEGYRLASLLQLYQTFPDLVVRRLPEDAIEGDVVPWDRWIVPLSLRLVNTLRKIPPDSGTRCIQPLLYLSASTGLKFDLEMMPTRARRDSSSRPTTSIATESSPCGGGGAISVGALGVFGPPFDSGGTDDSGDLELILQLGPAEVDSAAAATNDENRPASSPDLPHVQLTKLAIEVSHARRFVLERLSALEHSLPPAPVRVAKDLVSAIWAAYDGERPGVHHTHWIDVMEDLDLRTIFG